MPPVFHVAHIPAHQYAAFCKLVTDAPPNEPVRDWLKELKG